MSAPLAAGEHDAAILGSFLMGTGWDRVAGDEQDIALPVRSRVSLSHIEHDFLLRLLRCLPFASSTAASGNIGTCGWQNSKHIGLAFGSRRCRFHGKIR
jgi:hypothetical protein